MSPFSQIPSTVWFYTQVHPSLDEEALSYFWTCLLTWKTFGTRSQLSYEHRGSELHFYVVMFDV